MTALIRFGLALRLLASTAALLLGAGLLARAIPANAATPPSPPRVLTFDNDVAGKPPTGFDFARTGGGAEGQWLVRADPDKPENHLLVQESADPTDYRFPVAIVHDGEYRDLTLSVRARALSGKVDQGFGLVWRYRDANNYYLARCNADEDNCTIYHVIGGHRNAFLDKSVRVATKTWHALKVAASGDHFTVWFDGQAVLDAHDGTFKEPGRVGLWTKADSVIQFDDLTVAAQ